MINDHSCTRRSAAAILAGALVLSGGAVMLASPAQAVPAFAFERIDGTGLLPPAGTTFPLDRYATAADAALTGFGSADTVILTRGEGPTADQGFADALAGNYLAGALGAPVLLTRTGALPAATAQAIDQLGATSVIILGGTGAVSQAVQDQLEAQDYAVERLEGPTRYATAAAVARFATEQGEGIGTYQERTTGVLVNGERFADALAAGPISYAAGFPLLLTQGDNLPNETRAVIAELQLEQIIIVGGTGAVSAGVETAVEGIVGAPAVRLDGTGIPLDPGQAAFPLDRFATARSVADFAYEELGFDRDFADLARGDAFADALAAGAVSGASLTPLLLATPGLLPRVTEDLFRDNCATLTDGYLYGGTGAISQAVEDAAEAAARSCDVPPPPFDQIAVTPDEEVTQTAVANDADGDGVLTDDRTYTATGLEPGVEYRVTLINEASTSRNANGDIVFTKDPANAGLAVTGSPTADLTSVNGVAPVNNGGPGTAPTAFTGTTAVFTADTAGEAFFVVDGDSAPESVFPIVYRNGGGSTGGTPQQGGTSPRLELNADGTASEALDEGGTTDFVRPFDAIAVTPDDVAELTAVPNTATGDGTTADDRTYAVSGLVPGVQYRVTVINEASTTLDEDGERVFRDAAGTPPVNDGLAETGGPTADITSVDGAAPVNNAGGAGSPTTPTTPGATTTAVFTAGAEGTATFVVDGDAAPESVFPIVYRNGGGSTDSSPQQGGSSGRLNLDEDGTAAEALDEGGVIDFVAPAPADPAAAVSATGADAVDGDTVTVVFDEPVTGTGTYALRTTGADPVSTPLTVVSGQDSTTLVLTADGLDLDGEDGVTYELVITGESDADGDLTDQVIAVSEAGTVGDGVEGQDITVAPDTAAILDPVVSGPTTPDANPTDDRAYTASGLVPGVEYRITLVNDASVTRDAQGIRFTEEGTTGLVATGSPQADILSVDGAAPVNNTGEGTAASPFAGPSAVATADEDGVITFVVDGSTAESVFPVVYNNGGAGSTSSNGGASPRLEIDDEGRATEPFDDGGVITFVNASPTLVSADLRDRPNAADEVVAVFSEPVGTSGVYRLEDGQGGSTDLAVTGVSADGRTVTLSAPGLDVTSGGAPYTLVATNVGDQNGDLGTSETAADAAGTVAEDDEVIFVDAAADGTEDGSAENPFSSLQEAVALATDGDEVRVADGTYDTGRVVVDGKDVDLLAADDGNTTQPSLVGTVEVLRVTGGSLSGFALSAPDDEGGEDDQLLRLQDVTGYTVSGNTFTGSAGEGPGAGLVDENGIVNVNDAAVEQVTVSGNTFTGLRRGIASNESADLTVTGNTFADSVTGIATFEPDTLTGNTFDGLSSFAIALLGAGGDAVVTGNTFAAGNGTNIGDFTDERDLAADEAANDFAAPQAVNGTTPTRLQDDATPGGPLVTGATATDADGADTLTVTFNEVVQGTGTYTVRAGGTTVGTATVVSGQGTTTLVLTTTVDFAEGEFGPFDLRTAGETDTQGDTTATQDVTVADQGTRPAGDEQAFGFASGTTFYGSRSAVVTYDRAVDCTTVDADGSDYLLDVPNYGESFSDVDFDVTCAGDTVTLTWSRPDYAFIAAADEWHVEVVDGAVVRAVGGAQQADSDSVALTDSQNGLARGFARTGPAGGSPVQA